MRISTVAAALFVAGCASSGTPAAPPPLTSSSTRLQSQDASLPKDLDPRVPLAQHAIAPYKLLSPFDDVWHAVRVAYDSLGIPLNIYDERQHLLGNQGWNLRHKLGGMRISRYLDCGTTQIDFNADSYDIVLSYVAYV